MNRTNDTCFGNSTEQHVGNSPASHADHTTTLAQFGEYTNRVMLFMCLAIPPRGNRCKELPIAVVTYVCLSHEAIKVQPTPAAPSTFRVLISISEKERSDGRDDDQQLVYIPCISTNCGVLFIWFSFGSLVGFWTEKPFPQPRLYC